jgi:hypothetical protein
MNVPPTAALRRVMRKYAIAGRFHAVHANGPSSLHRMARRNDQPMAISR